MNAIAKLEQVAPLHTFDDMARMSEVIAKSGLFGMKTPEQAMGLMLVAQAEGQHPATITQEYDIIQGKATRKTHSVLARFQAAGGRLEWHQLDDTVADATFSHPMGGSLRLQWTMDMAKKANLAGKDNWKGYPRAMLRARLIAEGVRAVYPGAIGGFLVPEEAMDTAPVDVPTTRGPEKHMGEAEVVAPASTTPAKPAWPDDAFDKQAPRWQKAVEAGLKTVDDILTMAATKGALTPAQEAKVRAFKKAEPTVTYAQVAEKLHAAKDQQALDDAATLIGEVADPAQRKELTAIYDQRAAGFQE